MKRPSMKTPVPVYVEWVDSTVHTGWQHLSEYRPGTNECCQTLGWLIAENKHELVISAHYSNASKACHTPMLIPAGAVRLKKIIKI